MLTKGPGSSEDSMALGRAGPSPVPLAVAAVPGTAGSPGPGMMLGSSHDITRTAPTVRAGTQSGLHAGVLARLRGLRAGAWPPALVFPEDALFPGPSVTASSGQALLTPAHSSELSYCAQLSAGSRGELWGPGQLQVNRGPAHSTGSLASSSPPGCLSFTSQCQQSWEQETACATGSGGTDD